MVIAVSQWSKPITRRYLFRETLRGRVRARPCLARQGGLYPGVTAVRWEAAGLAERRTVMLTSAISPPQS